MNINLENGGERMDIDYYNLDYDGFDPYQKSHYHRYMFAKTLLKEGDVVGDMACGSGYGSMLLSENCARVKGYDIDETTISEITKRYKDESKVEFECKDLLEVEDENVYDMIVSFETIEHFAPKDIIRVIKKFYNALKPGGKLVFSTPYNQQECSFSIKFHKTFNIIEDSIRQITKHQFEIDTLKYQDYDSHNVKGDDGYKHFILCVATKI